jgi:hypothetical protein
VLQMIRTVFLIFIFLLKVQLSTYALVKRVQLHTGYQTAWQDTTFIGFSFPPHDSILHFDIGPVEMIGPYHYKNKKEEKKYNQLEKDVLKTFPLALIVSSEIKIVNAEFENSAATPSMKKSYIKWYQKYVYNSYIDSLKTLNADQGRILLQLIYRETGKTSYDLIKLYRGGLNAIFWQSMAFMAGANLNSKYDPANNAMIEHIIKRYKSGEFNPDY